jgi:hypothetical protein
MDPDINADYICQIQPTRVAHNVTFVLDCSYLPIRRIFWLTIWVYGNPMALQKLHFPLVSCQDVFLYMFVSQDNMSCIVLGTLMVQAKISTSLLCTLQLNKKVKKPTYVSFVFVDKSSKEFLNLALVAYTFTTGVEREVLVRPHGNSCSGQPYQKTLPSTLKKLKDTVMIEAKPAKSILSYITGDLVDAHSAGDMFCNQKQVYNSRQSMKITQQHSSPSQVQQTGVLYYLMEQSRRCYEDTQFVRDVKAAPESMCVLVTHTQLDNLVRFCTDHTQVAVLFIDPTFGIGEFNVTPIVFQHPMLESHCCGSSPIFLGPLLVHQKTEFS